MIRAFREEDTDQLVLIWRAASKIAHSFLAADFIEQEAENLRHMYLPHARTWVIEDNGSPVGFISMIESEIGGLFLNPNFHGKGFGRALVDQVAAVHSELHVEVFEKNAIGRRFYECYGFVETGRYKHIASNEMTLKLAMKVSES